MPPAPTGPSDDAEPTVLLLDDSAHVTDLFAAALESSLGCRVRTLTSPRELTDELLATERFAVAVVDLSFGSDTESGLDALLRLHLRSPETRLTILTQGDAWVADMLRDAVEILPIAAALSKSNPVERQISTIDQVLRNGYAAPDPILVPLLPSAPDKRRTIDSFARLVQHRGHAKLWAAVLACGPGAEYQDLAAHSGLRPNALRNYRAQLLPELVVHGLRNPPMRDLHAFAQRCRPFLAPFVEAKGITLDIV